MKKKFSNTIPVPLQGIKKLLLIMKLALAFVLMSVLQVSANVYSQSTVNLNVQDRSLRDVLKTIEQSSSFRFFYSDDLVLMNKNVDVKANNEKVTDVLDNIFASSELTYKVFENNLIVIVPKTEALQEFNVTGTVTNSDGEPLPGVNVLIEGTTMGVITDVNGRFSIKVPNENTVLVFSYIGFLSERISVGGQRNIELKLVEDIQSLQEVVVTALGMKREQKALGYAITQIKGDDIIKSNIVNPITGLQGKVAGMQINMGNGGPQSANRILIRGNSSLGTNNQPIFVVDGVIIDNSVTDNTEWGAALDFGNEIKNLNSDDFETVSVLKGAAATALYGSRAANGVVLITTKKGKKGEGLGVSLSQSMTWDDVYDFPDFQNEYGSGLLPVWSKNPDGSDNRTTTETLNFGPKFDGLPYTRNGKEYIHSAKSDNIKQMYQTGKYRNTNFALQGGDDKGTFRFSYSNLQSNGVTFNNEFKRNSFSFNASRQISSRINADAGFSWIKSDTKNPTFQGGGRSPIYDFAYSVPREYDTKYWLSNYKNPKGDGFNNQDPFNSYSRNIWEYLENNYLQEDNNFRSYLDIDFKILDWLTFTAKGDMNRLYLTREDKKLADGESNYTGSGYSIRESKKEQYKVTALLSAVKKINNFTVNATVAAEQWDTRRTWQDSWTVNGLRVPGKFDIKNSVKPAETDGLKNTDRKRINSVYAFINADYMGQIFLDITGRNDWSSSLIYSDGTGEVSYFYPSVSSSWIFTETFDLPSFFTFGKFRGSYAIVGNDTDPYLTSIGYYKLDGTFKNNFDGNEYPYYSFDSEALRNSNLKPEKQHSIEFGTEMKFLNNRLGLDLAWYKTNTKNQILALSQAAESGVSSRWINAGNIQNSGIELVISAKPIDTPNFGWDLTANYTRNRNKIVELAPDVEKYYIEGGGMDCAAWATVGGAYGDIYTAYAYKRNDKGEKVLNSSGAWIRAGTQEKIGSLQPDFLGGILSVLRYKNLSLNMLFDARYGGNIISGTYNYGSYSGALQNTLYGRDKEHGGLQRTLADGTVLYDGMIPEGVFTSGTIIGGVDVSGVSYQKAYEDGLVTPIAAQKYYENKHSWGSGIRESALFESSWIAFRELSVHYSIPQKFTKKVALNNVNVGFIIRNLGYLYNSLPDNIHPEGLPSNRSSAFVEIGGSAYTRSYGFNINVSF